MRVKHLGTPTINPVNPGTALMIITPIINLPMSQGGEEHKLDRSRVKRRLTGGSRRGIKLFLPQEQSSPATRTAFVS